MGGTFDLFGVLKKLTQQKINNLDDFILKGTLVIGIIIIAKKYNINPDNVATPIGKKNLVIKKYFFIEIKKFWFF